MNKTLLVPVVEQLQQDDHYLSKLFLWIAVIFIVWLLLAWFTCTIYFFFIIIFLLSFIELPSEIFHGDFYVYLLFLLSIISLQSIGCIIS